MAIINENCRAFLLAGWGWAILGSGAAVAQDCNADGIPDSQQLTQPVTREFIVEHFNTQEYAAHTFHDVPPAVGDVTVNLRARVNLGEALGKNGYGDLYINDVFIDRFFETVVHFCWPPAHESVVLDAATFESLRHAGSGDLFMEMRYDLADWNGCTTRTTFTLLFDANNDCDGDGLLNECETEDCDGNGIFDGCEIDTDGDGVIDDCDRCEGSDDSVDSDNDEAPDACDRCPGADDRRDCNGDSRADCLQLIDNYNIGDREISYCDDPYLFSQQYPIALGDVVFSYDFTEGEVNADDEGEWVEVILNGVVLARVLEGASTCDQWIGEVTIPAATWNAANDPNRVSHLEVAMNEAACSGPALCATFPIAFSDWQINYTWDRDFDDDGWLNECDACPFDAADDSDGDGTCDSVDICPGGDDTVDTDGDGTPDACDICPNDVNDDSDGDGVCDSLDLCPGGDDRNDADEDGTPNACDACPGSDDAQDADADGVPDDCDRCPGLDDNSPAECPLPDMDDDGILDAFDNCPVHPNPDQLDSDGPDAALTPVAAWRFEDAAGPTAADTVAAHHANVFGVNWLSGRYGNAVELNGTSSGMQISADDAFNFDTSASFTVMAWVKVPANQGYGAGPINVLVEKGPANGPYPFAMHLYNQATGDHGRVTAARSDGARRPRVTSTTRINDERWHHVALVRDASNMLRLYIDGVEEDATEDTTLFATTNPWDLFFGVRENGLPYFLAGSIDEVAIFAQGLSATQVEQIFEIGLGDGIGDACEAECPGDTDADGDVDLSDLAVVLGDFGRTGTDLPGDIDRDGDVDLTDLAEILGRFGRVC